MNVEPGTLIIQLLAMSIPTVLIVALIVLIVLLVNTRNEQKRTSQQLDRILALMEKEQN